MRVLFSDIEDAQKRLEKLLIPTELAYSHSCSVLLGTNIYLKFENTQRTGSFKIRGAYNKLSQLSDVEKKRGVVASSAGNHAQGVALSASLNQVSAKIVMPENAPLMKVSATKGYGAEVVLHGEYYDQAYDKACELAEYEGRVFVHPYEDTQIIAGQGTIGIEIFHQQKNIDTIIVPIGGGGLISGIAIAAKSISPKTKIIGVQSNLAAGMASLFHQQNVTESNRRISTIADGIAIKRPSQKMFDHFISKYVDEIVTVSDDELAAAMVFLLERAKTVVEGSGAAALAAAMQKKIQLGQNTVVILSGGNIDLNIVAKIIQQGQIKRGLLVELSVIVDDMPGTLSRLTAAIAQEKANVLEVYHDRVSQGLYLRETRIDFLLETTSIEHVEIIKDALRKAGGKIS